MNAPIASQQDTPDFLATPERRARFTQGISSRALYDITVRLLREKNCNGGRLVDVGCGKGHLWPHVSALVGEYVGVDLIEFEGFPKTATFVKTELNSQGVPLPTDGADAVIALGTIEYLENPWFFFRELVRIAKPGAIVIASTSNQLSLLSKGTLLFKNRYNAFQGDQQASKMSALLEHDFVRIASAAGLDRVSVVYTDDGRMPLTARSWPRFLGLRGRAFSEGIVLHGKKPG